MPPFGAHFSVAGGLTHAVRTAVRLRCDTLQMFTKSPSQWSAKSLAATAIAEFRSAVRDAGLRSVAAHDSYLINLAAPGSDLFEKSVAAFVTELERAEALGLDFLVMHPGAHVGSGEAAGLRRVVAGLNRAVGGCRGFRVRVLVETTAGQGTCLGWRFEHLAEILGAVHEPERYGVCFDTCHVFAAGYPLATPAEFADTFGRFDAAVGVHRIALFHLNDAAKPLGSRVDRHAGIGLGNVGLTAFGSLLRDSRFVSVPMILETPKKDREGREMDEVNLNTLRRLTVTPTF